MKFLRSCMTIIIGVIIIIYLFSLLGGTGGTVSRSTSKPSSKIGVNCFAKDGQAYWLDDSGKGSPIVKTANFAKGTLIAELGDSKDYGEVDINVGRGVAFIYRGTTYAAQAKYLGKCD